MSGSLNPVSEFSPTTSLFLNDPIISLKKLGLGFLRRNWGKLRDRI